MPKHRQCSSKSGSEKCKIKLKVKRDKSSSSKCKSPRKCETETCEVKIKCEETSEKDCGCKEKCRCKKVCRIFQERFTTLLATSLTPPTTTVGAVPGTVALVGTPSVTASVTGVGCGFVIVDGVVTKTVTFEGLTASGVATGPQTATFRLPFNELIKDPCADRDDIFVVSSAHLQLVAFGESPANTTLFVIPTVLAFTEIDGVKICIKKIKAHDPVITSIVQNTGVPGQTVTLIGRNLYPRAFGVLFGTIPSGIVSQSPTALVVTVPVGVAGEVYVTVTNVNGLTSNPVLFTGP
jgi:hypothetical protein